MTEALARLDLPRLTIDVDGSVIRTGATVGWAFRGFNPHHRKDPSDYPLVAHVAYTGEAEHPDHVAPIQVFTFDRSARSRSTGTRTHVAQTGHILRLKNRPGNVHDS